VLFFSFSFPLHIIGAALKTRFYSECLIRFLFILLGLSCAGTQMMYKDTSTCCRWDMFRSFPRAAKVPFFRSHHFIAPAAESPRKPLSKMAQLTFFFVVIILVDG